MPAKEIHVCGHECAVELVRKLADIMGERFEVLFSVAACTFPSILFNAVVAVGQPLPATGPIGSSGEESRRKLPLS